MVKIFSITKGQIARRRNTLGYTPTCECGCGHEFKINDIVHSMESGRGKSHWRLPKCMDRLRG